MAVTFIRRVRGVGDGDEGYVAALAVIGRCDTVVARSGTALLEAAAR
ncbi:MAG: hypothetical protein JO345_01575 [Streptosporangiaceae bacterium]|nr:hypothetical protein [Streptosporangiaceae bacterium]